jgi:cation-transporting ATPase 13A2
MASCHSLTYINEELLGDPLDIKMFESTNWIMDEVNIISNSIGSSHDLVLAYVRPSIDKSLLESVSSYDSPKENKRKYELAIIKRFDFESSLQRMSVIVKNHLDKSFRCYVKGSPEKVQELCIPETLPKDFLKQLEVYTRKGYRVIALAVKFLENTSFLKVQTTKREQVENNLHFLGFLVMENKLKPVT